MTTMQRLTALRRLMRREGLAAYLIPSTDPHQNEYVPQYWRRREWISGFSGSAGDVVVTQREAGLWTDSRYFLQAEQELDGRLFTLQKMHTEGTPTIEKYLAGKLRKGQVLGVDGQTVSKERGEGLEAALRPRDAKVRFLAKNLIDELWSDRPAFPTGSVVRHADRFAGETAPAKLARLREKMKSADAEAHVITALDQIAWLFNIRGDDVEYNPLVIAYAIIEKRTATLYVEPGKVSPRIQAWLRTFARLAPYGEFAAGLRTLGKAGKRILIDPDAIDRWVLDRLRGARFIFQMSPATKAKAVKNSVQIKGMRRAHVRDGVALVRFFHWLETARPRRLTEYTAAERLEAFRAEGHNYRGASFQPIVSWGGNGAIVHYSPKKATAARIGTRGILLLDTGGQYWEGTTDVTRTIALGEPHQKEKRFFTRVLQGHIQLSMSVFPSGINGGRLEVLARGPLWEERVDYGHGTGHGVGHYLCVHEGPMGFAPRSKGTLEAGNILTIEPGHYEAGKFGIRVENQVVALPEKKRVKKGEKVWLKFDALTMCPIDLNLIERDLMTAPEIAWLNEYHARVCALLTPHLEAPVREWLERATRAL